MVLFGLLFIVLLSFGAIGIWFLMSLQLLLLIPIIILLVILKCYPNNLINNLTSALFRGKQIYANTLGGLFLDYLTILLLYFCNIKVNIYQNKTNETTSNIGIIISNHRTRVDWLFVGFCYNYFINNNHKIYIILKDSLSSLPFYGWAMQMMSYIFLTRDKSRDLPKINESIDYLLDVVSSPTILIFPEGTDLSESNIDKCRIYCESKGLPIFTQVLYPKSLGLSVCVESLKGKDLYLQDLTIAYTDYQPNVRCSETAILKGEFPKEVHIFVDQYAIDDIPIEKSMLYKWTLDRFTKKEEVLKDYYNSNHFLSYVKDKYLEPLEYPTIKLIQTIVSLLVIIVIYIYLLSNEIFAVILGSWFIFIALVSVLLSFMGTGWDAINLILFDYINKSRDNSTYSAI